MQEYTSFPGSVIKQLIVVHRHGDRSPIARRAGVFVQTEELLDFWKSKIPSKSQIESWGAIDDEPTKTYLSTQGVASMSTWPNGHLTELGVCQLRRLGAELRERYVGELGLLPAVLPAAPATTAVIRARSTRYPRTVQSLQNLLLGLYPLDARQPAARVYIETRAKGLETLSGDDSGFPRLLRLAREARARRAAAAAAAAAAGGERGDECGPPERLRRVREELGAAMGEDPPAAEAAAAADAEFGDMATVLLQEVATCHASYGLPLPAGISHDQLTRLADLSAWAWADRYAIPDYGRLAVGNFVGDLLAAMGADNLPPAVAADAAAAAAAASADGLPAPPAAGLPLIQVYSGHDSTLIGLLTLLRAFDHKWPVYAAHLELEVWEEAGGGARRVRLVYNGRPWPMLGHGADGVDWRTFCDLLAPLVPSGGLAESRAPDSDAAAASAAAPAAAACTGAADPRGR